MDEVHRCLNSSFENWCSGWMKPSLTGFRRMSRDTDGMAATRPVPVYWTIGRNGCGISSAKVPAQRREMLKYVEIVFSPMDVPWMSWSCAQPISADCLVLQDQSLIIRIKKEVLRNSVLCEWNFEKLRNLNSHSLHLHWQQAVRTTFFCFISLGPRQQGMLQWRVRRASCPLCYAKSWSHTSAAFGVICFFQADQLDNLYRDIEGDGHG